eukprot:1162009-Pelagomonas_calceolata.AAC.2
MRHVYPRPFDLLSHTKCFNLLGHTKCVFSSQAAPSAISSSQLAPMCLITRGPQRSSSREPEYGLCSQWSPRTKPSRKLEGKIPWFTGAKMGSR